MADNLFSIDVIVRASQAVQGSQQAKAAIKSVGDEAKATAEKAKASLSLLSEELGVTIPGEVQSLIAELPGVGTALKAAFSATVVIAVIQVLAEVAEKIEALSQQAEKHREAWIAIESTMGETTQKTEGALDRQKAKYIEVTQGPLKAMEYELQHMQSIALSVFPGIASEMDKLAQQFGDEGGIWTEWQRANKQAGIATKKTLADVREQMSQAIKNNPKDLLAPFDAALGVLQKKVTDLQGQIGKLPTTELLHSRFTGSEKISINQDKIKVLTEQKNALTEITHQLEAQRAVQVSTSEAAAAQHKLAQLKDEIAARAQVLNADKNVEDQKRRLTLDTARLELQEGKITADQEEAIRKAALKKELDDTVHGLRQRQQLQLKDTSLTARQRKAIRESTHAEIKAAELKYQDDMVHVEEAANQRKTQDFLGQIQSEVAATKSGSKERVEVYKGVLDQMREMGQAGLPAFRQLMEQYNAAAQEYENKRIKGRLQLDEEEVRHNEQMALADLEIRRKTFENEITAHKKKNSEVVEQEKEFLRQELQIKVDALKQKLRVMAKDPDVSVVERRRIEDQILELEKQYALKRINIKKDEVNRRKHLEQAFEQTIKSSVSSGLMGMLQGTESFAQAMRDLYAGLVQDVVNLLAEMLTQWIATHLLMKVFGIASGEEEAGSVIAHEAGKTYAATFSDMAQLGPAGLAAAPGVAAAAAASVTVGARAAMAEGGQWNVPGLQFTLLHPQEMVLPANLASRMRDVIDGRVRNGAGSGITVVVNHSVNAVDADSFQKVIRRHGNLIGNEVARVLKKRGMSPQ